MILLKNISSCAIAILSLVKVTCSKIWMVKIEDEL